ncbi:TonB-dependent receptor [Terrimonas sp.]|uniref:TonB-dependent receptor n=1 Tax=Terrimonas sp. TaxID=1914338 RepID=UPI000D50CB53|nr:TonB-dependent receptor [Terrimonas sp.]PVD53467.1 TonB-dependent receptor [Terrimonas sp.]
MKSSLMIIMAIAMHIGLLAQTTIKGKVTEKESNLPVPNATVSISVNLATVSDGYGNFSITGLRQGTYTVTVSGVGYRTVTQSVQTGAELNIALERIPLMLQPVEIRAVRAGERAPFAKSNLSKKEIEKVNTGQDLPFVLNQLPSVVVNSDAGNGVGYTGLRIRGSDATRINVTLNGIPYNDAESQGSFFVDLPDFVSSVNSIQVQRGVGTSSNGAGAFGATINMTTNEFIEEAYAESNNTFGSFNTWKHTLKAGTGLINGHFTIDARLSSLSSDGYIDRAGSNLKSFYVSTAYINNRTSLRFNVFSGKEKTYQAWNGVPESMLKINRTYNSAGTDKPGEPYDNETDNYVQTHYQLFLNQGINDNWSFNIAGFLSRGKGYYEQYKGGESLAKYGLQDIIIGDSVITETDLIRQLWLDNYYYGGIFSLQYKNKGTQWLTGGGWNRYDGGHYGKIIWSQTDVPNNYEWYNLNAKKTDFNIYTKLQQRVAEHFDIFGDIQYRNIRYTLNGFRDNPDLLINNNYHFINPKAGLSYTNNNWTAFASYAIASKEPNRDDFEAGASQQPKPERLQDIELGIEQRSYSFSWGANFYYMQYKNQLVQTGKINDVGAYTRTNVPNSYRAGIELQAKWQPLQWLNASANIAFSKNKIKDYTAFYDDYDNGGQKAETYKETDISFSPSIVGAGMLNFIPAKNVEFSLLSKYVGKQYLDNTSSDEKKLNTFYVQDVRLTYAISKFLFKEINLLAQVNNIFNKKYEPNGYTYGYIYEGKMVNENFYFPIAGTNFVFGLNVKF